MKVTEQSLGKWNIPDEMQSIPAQEFEIDFREFETEPSSLKWRKYSSRTSGWQNKPTITQLHQAPLPHPFPPAKPTSNMLSMRPVPPSEGKKYRKCNYTSTWGIQMDNPSFTSFLPPSKGALHQTAGDLGVSKHTDSQDTLPERGILFSHSDWGSTPAIQTAQSDFHPDCDTPALLEDLQQWLGSSPPQNRMLFIELRENIYKGKEVGSGSDSLFRLGFNLGVLVCFFLIAPSSSGCMWIYVFNFRNALNLPSM